MKWYVQQNLGSERDLAAMERACDKHGHGFERIAYQPFSLHPPSVPHDEPALFYGAPNLIRLVAQAQRWSPGVYWSDEAFRASAWGDAYQEDQLNRRAIFTQLDALLGSGRSDEEVVFLRPDRDLKEFAGSVLTMEELRRWAVNALQEDTTLDGAMRVLVGPAIEIDAEWRCFVVDGEVVAASLYRAAGELSVSEGAPREVVLFCERLSLKWSPARVFIMDIAAHQGHLSVIEINGFHSSGFYAASIDRVIDAVSSL